MDENRAQLGDFVKRAGNPQTGQFLAHRNEDNRHRVIEGCLWNEQLWSGQPKFQPGQEGWRDMASTLFHYAVNQPCLIDYWYYCIIAHGRLANSGLLCNVLACHRQPRNMTRRSLTRWPGLVLGTKVDLSHTSACLQWNDWLTNQATN
jgi:hypothetical protein